MDVKNNKQNLTILAFHKMLKIKQINLVIFHQRRFAALQATIDEFSTKSKNLFFIRSLDFLNLLKFNLINFQNLPEKALRALFGRASLIIKKIETYEEVYNSRGRV
jgi:hypothetical protein